MKKPIYLFLALLLPILVFLFLKFFGKNEFAVPPLYVSDYPKGDDSCVKVSSLPYIVPDSVMTKIFHADSLSVIFFGALQNESANQFSRVKDETAADHVSVLSLPMSPQAIFWRNCIFFLGQSKDVVLVDSRGYIRGDYKAADREEIDRLLTEITIILKKY